jgi:hypothetical protein
VANLALTIMRDWDEICDQATLSQVEPDSLWRREFHDDYAFFEQP